MREIFAATCKKPRKATYLGFVFRTEPPAQRVYKMISALVGERGLNAERERVYAVIAIEPREVQVIVVFNPADDHDELIELIRHECMMRLSFRVSLHELPESDHAEISRVIHMARAQDN
jgi:hypothetical protein